MTRRRALLASSAMFVVFAALGVAIVSQAERLRVVARRQAATHVAAGAAFTLERQLSRSLSAAYALASIVRQHGRIDGFDDLVAEMLPVYGGISSLALAPDGVISDIQPRAGNEPAMGHDLLHDPDRRFEARAAVESRRLTLAGPFQLRQGGFGIVGRLAVFLPDDAAPGRERFWGLVSVVIRFSDLLEATDVGRLVDDGYAYELSRLNRVTGARERIAAGTDPLTADPLSFAVKIPDGEWYLSVTPHGGWSATPWSGVLQYSVALLGAAALAAVAFLLLRQPEILRLEVAARTADLARAVAEQRKAEEQLRESQKMEAIGRLAGGIAHDFNNVLTGILGHASVLAEKSAPGSEVRKIAETIAGAANRAAALTTQLLGFARRGKLLTAPLDVHALVREVTRLLDRTIDKSIRIVERLEAPRSVVVGDASQLHQVVLNLAVNARDAMPHGGELSIETGVVDADARWCERHPGASPGKYLALTVADTGHGIPRDVLDRIFEPFFTTKGPGRGTGMGLAMVYGIARNHGGVVCVASEEGRGARFTVHLPLADAEVASPEAPAITTAVRGSGLVLVIDDDEVPRSAAASMLRKLGYDVLALPGGEEAVRWWRDRRQGVVAVLVDLAMPGMDGGDCYRALRELDPRVPFVLMSGYGRDGRAQELLDEGMHAFVQKPFGPVELGDAIARAIAAARSRDADRLAVAEPLAAGRAGETILLVEDEDDVRPVMEYVLESKGYRVLSAQHGREALELASTVADIDLLLTDVVMPEMGGPELAQRLGRPGLPVLYMSGLDARRSGGVAGEGAAFLQKPFTPDLLTRAVRDVLDRRASKASGAAAPEAGDHGL